jgi:hypothetical protein
MTRTSSGTASSTTEGGAPASVAAPALLCAELWTLVVDPLELAAVLGVGAPGADFSLNALLVAAAPTLLGVAVLTAVLPALPPSTAC